MRGLDSIEQSVSLVLEQLNLPVLFNVGGFVLLDVAIGCGFVELFALVLFLIGYRGSLFLFLGFGIQEFLFGAGRGHEDSLGVEGAEERLEIGTGGLCDWELIKQTFLLPGELVLHGSPSVV